MAAMAMFPSVMRVLESTSVGEVRQCRERVRDLAKATRAQEEQLRLCVVQLRDRITQLSKDPVGGCRGDLVQGPGDVASERERAEVASADHTDFGFVTVQSGGL
jgi:hypothetical protein